MAGLAIGIVSYVESKGNEPVTPEQQELLNRLPTTVGWPCHVTGPEKEPELASSGLIRARVECEPVDPGPEYVTFSLFTTEADQHEHMQKLAAYFDRRDSGCGGPSFDRMAWVDSTGDRRGELVCGESSGHVDLFWSDKTNNLIGSARGPKIDELYRWWMQTVKFDGDGQPVRAERRLRSYLPPSFGECTGEDQIAPAALIAVECDAGWGISSAGAYLYSRSLELKEHLQELVEHHPGVTKKGCWYSTSSYTKYRSGRPPRPVQGRLLCYVSDGAQWFVWTVKRTRVMAYASRADENWAKLLDAWENSLYDIHGYR